GDVQRPGTGGANIGTVTGGARGRDPPRPLKQRSYRRRTREIVSKALLSGLLRFALMHYFWDHCPHTRHRVGQRDQPQPTHIRTREHSDVAGPAALGARDALVLRMNGNVAQKRVVFMTAKALRENPGPPRSVDDDPDASSPFHAVRIPEAKRYGVGLKSRIDKAVPL